MDKEEKILQSWHHHGDETKETGEHSLKMVNDFSKKAVIGTNK